VLKHLSAILDIRVFVKHLFVGICVPVPTHFSPGKTSSYPSKRSFEERNEMTFDLSLANITDYWSVSSRFILPFLSKSDKNALHVITVVKKAILIFLLLSFDS